MLRAYLCRIFRAHAWHAVNVGVYVHNTQRRLSKWVGIFRVFSTPSNKLLYWKCLNIRQIFSSSDALSGSSVAKNTFQFSGNTVKIKDRRIFHTKVSQLTFDMWQNPASQSFMTRLKNQSWLDWTASVISQQSREQRWSWPCVPENQYCIWPYIIIVANLRMCDMWPLFFSNKNTAQQL